VENIPRKAWRRIETAQQESVYTMTDTNAIFKTSTGERRGRVPKITEHACISTPSPPAAPENKATFSGL